ncbi:MAG: Denitrification system component NirT [Candidatus Muproteobacteria bacterium RIFCSPHIGHO2_12_FULL_60_33]|uniref:Cytochrome c-type protein n=1 Tax=Candidatus Muproteobacteria bacterium RIFCSPLOWO2_01_FULL_60_18 TaxID=1817768 RepID=A0A1F6TWY3_9PROT|nr:MAG: Denitrification system component NirT [Candidatus Muproteobacteria bacterium RIFCSPLOWO2_01_FULL_60_18]OGI51257.1 MAG: Denitrification system component NirT [Candidatus Muproteobacteria bacterium RIFCSPHIGHO2_01_60_12]OGI53898.1 MAG: Denitrification system component NirT [Candidatus Muproteobacteria bacterium RIFCSPHIGHO2_12_FULL_60_33]
MGDRLKKMWRAFRAPSTRYAAGTLLVIGGVGGIIFWGGFNTFMEYTNKMEFCLSCHEMRAAVFEEYKQTVHYQNTSGVRAICSDCHVPKVWEAKLWRKIQATFKELPHKILGSIDTPEKFEAKRLELAEHVWASMKATDSRECRNCHDLATMTIDTQKRRAQVLHADAKKSGETCIDCHQGIAHKEPKKPG